jgi:hypothetical protein
MRSNLQPFMLFTVALLKPLKYHYFIKKIYRKSLYFGPRHGCLAKIWPLNRFGLPTAVFHHQFIIQFNTLIHNFSPKNSFFVLFFSFNIILEFFVPFRIFFFAALKCDLSHIFCKDRTGAGNLKKSDPNFIIPI